MSFTMGPCPDGPNSEKMVLFNGVPLTEEDGWKEMDKAMSLMFDFAHGHESTCHGHDEEEAEQCDSVKADEVPIPSGWKRVDCPLMLEKLNKIDANAHMNKHLSNINASEVSIQGGWKGTDAAPYVSRADAPNNEYWRSKDKQNKQTTNEHAERRLESI